MGADVKCVSTKAPRALDHSSRDEPRSACYLPDPLLSPGPRARPGGRRGEASMLGRHSRAQQGASPCSPGTRDPGRVVVARVVLLAAVAAVGVSGCARNPVTGRPEVVLVSAAQERQLGEKESHEVATALGL